MITIDGSMGEGGGQVVRTSLALSLATGTPIRIRGIRAGRSKPGLLRQHLAAVRAAAAVSGAEVSGAELGSSELTFRPRTVTAGEYRFSIGSAGSTTLVLQTVLLPLLAAGGASRLTLEGGTHNPMAPPYDFVQHTFLPLLRRMGARVEARLERAGFFPAGGGCIVVTIEPSPPLAPIELLERGALRRTRARAVVANLPRHIAERELRVVQSRLGWEAAALEVEVIDDRRGPGNVVVLTVEYEHVTEVFTAFGERHVPAETVAARASEEAARYLASTVPVGCHLADQLLLPMALGGGGRFRTLALTRHTTTNIDLIQQLTTVCFRLSERAPDDVLIEVQR